MITAIIITNNCESFRLERSIFNKRQYKVEGQNQFDKFIYLLPITFFPIIFCPFLPIILVIFVM